MGKSRAGWVIVVVLVLLALVVMLGIAALTGYFTPREPNGTRRPTAVTVPERTVADNGVKILFNTNCAKCHGEDGSKKAGWRAEVKEMTAEEIIKVINDGKGPMPSYSDKLTKDEIAILAEYSSSLATLK